MSVPAQGTVQETYSHHLRFDGVVPSPNQNFSMDFIENLLGHRSGIGVSTPWGTVPARSTQQAYQDTNLGSLGNTTYGATTVTDTNKAWTTNQWVGKTVFAFSAGALTKLVVTSNSATALTGSGGWSNGQPANNTLYFVEPDQALNGKLYDNFWAMLRQLGNPQSI